MQNKNTKDMEIFQKAWATEHNLGGGYLSERNREEKMERMENNNYIDRDVDRDVDIEILDWEKNLQIFGLWLPKKKKTKLNNQKKKRKKKPTWIYLYEISEY